MTFRGNFVGREMDRQAAALRRCRRCGATDRPLTDGRCTPCEKRDEQRRADHARRPKLTQTEAAKRLRAAAKLARETRGFPTNWRTEVGARAIPVYADTEFEAKTMAFDPNDDLVEFASLGNAAKRFEQTRLNGYVVHLYFSSNGMWGELEDVVTVWTGTGTIPPAIIN